LKFEREERQTSPVKQIHAPGVPLPPGHAMPLEDLSLYPLDGYMKGGEMGRACNKHEGEEKCIYNFVQKV
jgi:hypothetical protein